MTHANDSRCRRRTRRQFTAAALVLLASVGWAQQVSAAYTRSGGSAASGKIGGGLVTALAIDPDTPTTLYAATTCSGVLKSLDGGDSWSAFRTGLTNTYVAALAIDPTTPTTLYAGTNGNVFQGVFRSLNGGSSWQATGLMETGVTALAINPATPTTLYAGTYGGVFRSLNGGSSWSEVNSGLTDTDIRALAIDPTTPTTLYAGAFDRGGVFRSLNGGSSWQAAGVTSRYVTALAINPTTPTTLYAGTYYGGVFRTLNGGSSWQATGLIPGTLGDIALAINPTTPTTLYAAKGSGGVFRSLNGGSSWSEVNTGLTNTYVTTLAIDPTTPTTLYAGTQGVVRSLNGGSSWQATGLGNVTCGDGLAACGEQCDDGGESATCDTNCTLAQCGDGTLNVTAGEQCDDGNRNPFDGCTNDCTVCGDGVVTPPEECDDGNTSSGDGCDAQCRRPHVVGTGTPASCTEAALNAALAVGLVTFNCGPTPVTITLTSEKAITATTTIDGGGRITLSGGGAVRIFRVDESAGLEVRSLTITNGSAVGGGGGILNFGGTLTVISSTFTGNVTADTLDRGGGILNIFGILTVINSTFSGNSAGSGGAIANYGTLSVANSTFSGNSAGYGGALYNEGMARLTNCTLSENGGAVANFEYCWFGGCQIGSVTLINTIIAESAGLSCGEGAGGPITDGGHNLQFPGTSCGGTIQSLDPLLDPAGLTDNGGPTQTIALLATSPAINAADADVCATAPVNGVDQRGYVRPGTGYANCSIGAYEYNSPGPPLPCGGDCHGDGRVTIDELITLVNIALGTANVTPCTAGDVNGDGATTINEIIIAVNSALRGCGGAGVWYVDARAPAGGDARSWGSAFQFVTDALAAAQVGDTIHVAQGTYRPDRSAASPDGSG